jgi:hypothetical protein
VKRRAARTLAHVTQTERLINCANCGRPVRAADVGDLGWSERVDSDGVRSHVCPLCDRFGPRVDIGSRTGCRVGGLPDGGV